MTDTDHPKKLGRYEVRKILGRGAMGVVYLGHDARIDRPVALKTIRSSVLTNPKQRQEFMERFFREARAAGKLNHPGIVTVYEADEDEESGVSYIAMEYVEGASLEQYLASQKRMSPDLVLKMMRQLLQALDYAHAKGTVHRDIKPANVLLERSGDVKLLDFGIARLSASDLTQTGQYLGTPGYMSPEQLKGKDVDSRSDLFSTAVLLYQALTGNKPFQGEDFATTCYQVLSVDPPPPRELVSDLPAGIDAVLRRALAKEPTERYQTGAEFLSDLEQALAGKPPRAADMEITGGTMLTGPGQSPIAKSRPPQPVAAQPGPGPGVSAGAPPAARRGPSLGSILGVVAAVAVVAAGAWYFLLRDDSSAQRTAAAASRGTARTASLPAATPPTDSSATEERPDPIPEETPSPSPPPEEPAPAAEPEPEPEPTPARTSSPAPRDEPAPATTPPPVRPPEVREPPPVVSAVTTVPLHIEVYHRLPGGIVIVYVDEEKALTHSFEGHVKVRKSNFDIRMNVPVGTHKLRITVAPKGDWGKVLTGRSQRRFEAGKAYWVDVKVGTLGRDLDLEWH